MNLLMKKLHFLIIFLLFFNKYSVCSSSQSILGTISFPKTLKNLPPISLYIGGLKLVTQQDLQSKKLLFHIPKKKEQTEYTLVITTEIIPQKSVTSTLKKQNIIEYLKVDPEQTYKYKFYKISLKDNKWTIVRQLVDEHTGRIPDNTIIVFCPPEFVQELRGNSEFEFPSVVIKSNLLSMFTNEEAFQNSCAELQFKTIDINTIHTPMQQMIKTGACRTLILPTSIAT